MRPHDITFGRGAGSAMVRKISLPALRMKLVDYLAFFYGDPGLSLRLAKPAGDTGVVPSKIGRIASSTARQRFPRR